MITLLIGDNTFEHERELRRIINNFDGTPERVDGEELELRRLPDLLMGTDLFAKTRLVIIKNLSRNKSLWGSLGEILGSVSDDIELVLLEPDVDRRTKTYKLLQKHARVVDMKAWTDRDQAKAEVWAVQEAREQGFTLDKKSAHSLVSRVGADQWLLAHALEKLAVVGAITTEVIEDIVDANPSENVFNLLDAALQSNPARIRRMLQVLEMSEDPYRLFGLLGSQVFQLASLAVAERPSADVAKDLGVHPFALSKLAPHARRLGRRGGREVVEIFAEADHTMKTSAHDPWLVIEQALMRLAHMKK